MIISNYEIVEKVAETPHAVVYKAYRKSNPERLLVLKVLKATFLSDYKRSQIRQKIEHLRILKDALVITPLSLGEKDDNCFIAQDYFEGVTLDKLMEEHSPVSLTDFFTIACRLAGALEKVHSAGIIHGGIKPQNILVTPGTLDIRLIDFISALDVRDVSHFIYDHCFVRGTLAYTSPEQTGRISHRVVFSSDLYSLGIVFYEMLTGHLPYYSDDPLELIHSHLAKEAPGVHELNPAIPTVLSDIVAELMFKEPEKRYQTSSGLLADLVKCRDEYSATGTIREFPLESRLYAHRAAFISRMVGRDREAEIILEEYEQVARGAFRSTFISGLPGIGKTRLIQELQKPIVKHKGYFTSGKFDVYQKNIPYSSITQALRNLIKTFLTESNERVALWKNRILEAVGENGKLVTDVIPELEAMIGPQPELQQLPPVESLNRFHDVFNRFLTCLASEENPLTLFIDDLQWCDAASFDFLAYVFANYREHPHLFFLGAYRHNEVDSSHPLSKLIRNIREGRWPLKEIRLEALRPEDCHEMVSYILDSPLPQTRELSDFISALTEGNPLFVSESLSYLYHENLLFLDEKRQWRWDLDRIRQSRMPTTVVSLFSSKIQRLPPDLVTLLEYCACMGNTFSPAELSSIREMTLHQTFEMLRPALEQGLLTENKDQLQFIHDRVQEAALSGIPDEKLRQIHSRIGNHLLAAIPEGTGDIEKLDNLFSIVSQLNLGREENPDSKRAYFLSDMNYHAGNKALDSIATQAANKYFNLAREFLPEDCWDDSHYERTFRIFQKAAKTELMCGNYENSERLINELLDHAKTDLDKTETLAEQTVSLSSIGNFIKAIETANRGLAYFGKAIPDNLGEVDKRREELMAEIASMDMDIRETLLNMPLTTDRKKKVESAFYSELIADLYLSGRVPEMYLMAAQATLHCLSGGMDEGVIYAFCIMGSYFEEREEFEQSFIYGDLGRALAAKYPNTFAATKCMNGVAWIHMHTRSHPRDIVDYSLKAIQCGKACGDLNNAGISYGPLLWDLQVQGANLPVIEDYARECLQFATRYHLAIAARFAEATEAGWVEPMKKEYAPPLSERMGEKLVQWERDNHIAPLASYHVHKALTHYYFGEHEEAEEQLLRAEQHLLALSNSVLKREWHVFRVLNALRLYEKGIGAKSKRKLMSEIRPIIKKIEKWASFGPLFKPYLAFAYAELARVSWVRGSGVQGSMVQASKAQATRDSDSLEQGTLNDERFREARSLYLDAINIAHDEEYTFLEGHLNECLGELLLKAGQHSARLYFAEAARLYGKCRADRKEARLTGKYEEELSTTVTPPLPSPPTLPDLDVEYLMRSSLAISAEMEQEVLLKKVMDVVIESSGAQHGYLLIDAEGDLYVRAESHVTDKGSVKTSNKRLEDGNDICKAIVRYVHRTGERLILSNASQGGPFKDNPEVQGMQLRSVMCIPVIKQSKMIGVLYLENRLADSLFTSEKTKMTELLTSQAAVSLENVRLMEREQFLADIVRNASVAMATGDADGRLGTFNVAFQKLTGYSEEELKSVNWNTMLTPPEWREHEMEKLSELHLTKSPISYEKEYIRKDGSRVPIEVVVHPIFDDSGKISHYFAFVSDISERKLHEERIKTSLREKEVLLREIHHRVKNNLQIIQSMLNLQLPHIKDEQAIELFKESQNRVYSMALIHEKLYESESLAKIDLAEYIRGLTASLFLSYGMGERSIRTKIHIDKVPLGIDAVIPCALIINELVSNSLKHAFPISWRRVGGTGEIGIDLRPGTGDKFVLTVSDNGVGLPEGFTVEHSESLGLKLVSILVRQLRGAIDLNTSGRTEFVITFEGKK